MVRRLQWIALVCGVFGAHHQTLTAAVLVPTEFGTVTDFPLGGPLDSVFLNQIVLTNVTSSQPRDFRGIIEFDISSLAQLTSAVLTIQPTGFYYDVGGPKPVILSSYTSTANGVVELADYGPPLTTLATFTATAGDGPCSFDVLPLVQATQLNGSTFLGFNLRIGATDVGGIGFFNPAIVYESNAAVPEPSTLFMFGVGGLGLALGGIRRRRPRAIQRAH